MSAGRIICPDLLDGIFSKFSEFYFGLASNGGGYFGRIQYQ